MKNFQRILPVVAVIAALGGAIYYVQSNAPARPEQIEVSKAAPAPGNTAPVSDRYSSNATFNN
jgi:hypothetical protein